MTKILYSKDGITSHRTKRSLNSTATTRLFNVNIDEQLITSVTGHRSLAVRSYQRVNETKKQSMCNDDTELLNPVHILNASTVGWGGGHLHLRRRRYTDMAISGPVRLYASYNSITLLSCSSTARS